MGRFEETVNEIVDGRELNAFDMQAVKTVAGLMIRVQDAREAVMREGSIIDDGKGFPVEHPGLIIEKRASQEIRGWVKDRPDLFGERKQTRARSSRPNFKVVS